jgi:hypothetical protein
MPSRTDSQYLDGIKYVLTKQYDKKDEPFSAEELRSILDNVADIVDERDKDRGDAKLLRTIGLA